MAILRARISRAAGWIAGVAMASSLIVSSGCYYPGGPMASLNQYTFESTNWQPWTITLVDTRTNQPFWSVDVPVGRALVMRFLVEGNDPTNEFTPDSMNWDLLPLGQRYGDLRNTLPIPPIASVRIQSALRKTPEMAESMMSGTPPIIIEDSRGTGAGATDGPGGSNSANIPQTPGSAEPPNVQGAPTPVPTTP